MASLHPFQSPLSPLLNSMPPNLDGPGSSEMSQ